MVGSGLPDGCGGNRNAVTTKRQHAPGTVPVVVGTVLAVLGLAWITIFRLLVGYDPLHWGGPNIGGGALFALAVAAAATGVVLLAAGWGGLWPEHRRPLLASAVVVTVLAATAGTVLVVRPGDPSAGLSGSVAVRYSETGSLQLHLAICKGTVDTVTVVGPNRGSTPNELIARYVAGSPLTTSAVLDLSALPAGWSLVEGRGVPVTGSGLLIATAGSAKNELRQVSFTPEQARAVPAGEVLAWTTPGHLPVSDFVARACG
jgi:hypothetical protein